MKLYLILLIAGFFAVISANAQNLKVEKTDSLRKEIFIPKKFPLNNQLKLNNPLAENQFKLVPPGTDNQNLFPANRLLNENEIAQKAELDNMPVVMLKSQSKMPVHKPDSTVQYFLKIKKIGGDAPSVK